MGSNSGQRKLMISIINDFCKKLMDTINEIIVNSQKKKGRWNSLIYKSKKNKNEYEDVDIYIPESLHKNKLDQEMKEQTSPTKQGRFRETARKRTDNSKGPKKKLNLTNSNLKFLKQLNNNKLSIKQVSKEQKKLKKKK